MKSNIEPISANALQGVVDVVRRWKRLLVLSAAVSLVIAMTLHPPKLDRLLEASPVILIHLACALVALVIGTVLLSRIKGSRLHKRLGWVWVVAMTLTAGVSLFIKVINPGHFSLIHILSGWVLFSLPTAIWAIRSKNVRRHSRFMTGMFVGGLLIAGFFTFLPGRLMHQVFLS